MAGAGVTAAGVTRALAAAGVKRARATAFSRTNNFTSKNGIKVIPSFFIL